ncbi:MAG: hypothetical protein V3T05_09300 [Myxococcota bacterium]
MKDRKPRWGLRGLQKAAKQPDGLELTESKAVEPIIASMPDVVDRKGAVAYVRDAILALTAGDFSHSVPAMRDEADVYGVRKDDRDWFVKVTLQEVADASGKQTKQVLVVSFHEPKKPFRTLKGELKPWPNT